MPLCADCRGHASGSSPPYETLARGTVCSRCNKSASSPEGSSVSGFLGKRYSATMGIAVSSGRVEVFGISVIVSSGFLLPELKVSLERTSTRVNYGRSD